MFGVLECAGIGVESSLSLPLFLFFFSFVWPSPKTGMAQGIIIHGVIREHVHLVLLSFFFFFFCSG